MDTTTSTNEDAQSSSFNYGELFTVVWQSRKLIGVITGSVTLAFIVFSLLLHPYYKSSVVILPETSQSKLASLGGLSDLASLAGVNVGGETSPAKLYPTVIKSEAVLRNVIYQKYHSTAFPDSVNLLQIWGIDEETPLLAYEKMLKALQDDLEIILDTKTNVLTISLSTKEPQLSADILNAIAHELDIFFRTKKRTNASEQRKWIEGRLLEVNSDLEKSENALKDFREKNRRVTDSPVLLLEQERLLRDVQINTTIFAELKKQYEIAKIEEIKNIPIVNVMDAGRAAAKKDKPQRGIIVVVGFLLSFSVSVVFVYGRVKFADKIRAFRAFAASVVTNTMKT